MGRASQATIDRRLVSISARRLIIVDENHGGYLSGHCLMCGRAGWTDQIVHARDCSVARALEEPMEDAA